MGRRKLELAGMVVGEPVGLGFIGTRGIVERRVK